MAIASSKRKFDLGANRALWVVREDWDKDIIFSVVQNGGDSRLQTRVRFKLSAAKALELAKFLANIATLDTSSAVFRDDEETDPG